MDSTFSLELVDKNFLSGAHHLNAAYHTTSFTLRSPESLSDEFEIQYILKDAHGKEYSAPTQNIQFEKEDITLYFPLDFLPNSEELLSGTYVQILKATSENKALGNNGLVLLARDESLRLFHHIDDFEFFDDKRWEIRKEFPLGRGHLLANQVKHDNNRKKIYIGLETSDFSGGEIRSIETFQHGSFRTSMKLANAPGSITGFFLYSPPDYYHEIDIEVFNDSSGTVLFTMYKDGQEWNHTKTSLGFDPTKDFHEYRMDVYNTGISFYVDNVLLEHWEGNFTYDPMQLMINSWYPSWLDVEPSVGRQETIIDWINY